MPLRQQGLQHADAGGRLADLGRGSDDEEYGCSAIATLTNRFDKLANIQDLPRGVANSSEIPGPLQVSLRRGALADQFPDHAVLGEYPIVAPRREATPRD